MRNAFADELTKLGNEDPRVVMLSGDIGNRLFDKFKDKHPSRFFNCGVAEANMMGVAAGMAMNGLRPVAYTITPFVTTRCLEQIRTDVCYHEAPVTIVAVGASAPIRPWADAPRLRRHLLHALDSNMVVVCPGDAFEVRGALRAAMQQNHPVYIRMGKKGEPVVHKGPIADFKIGKAITIAEGTDVCLLSTGNMLPEAIEAAHKLKDKGVSAEVVSFHTVKPLDDEWLKSAFARFKLVTSIEEQSLIGGCVAAVSEWLVDTETKHRKFLRYGTPDAFFKKSGEQEYAREVLGLTGHQIADKIINALS